ncbi:MAG: ATP-dependent DNA ligase [Candidatus Micrarchaeota archaeon]|nr:ATP-dependent DNA ligase [Candidatus Micrarchaeota archaeon]
MDFLALATAMHELESTRSRNQMVDIIASLFRKLTPEEIQYSVYLLQGMVAPPHKGIEIGLGEKLVEEAISKATGYSQKDVQKLYLKLGDLGGVAEQLCSGKRQTALFSSRLSIQKVYSVFYKIATLSGHGSQDMKISMLTELINNASPLEAKYIVRFPIGRLRLGVGDPTVLDALSVLHRGDKGDRELLESKYNICSDLGMIAKAYAQDPASLSRFTMVPFTPVRPALAERLSSAEEIINKLGQCIVEAKYDGFRVQVHRKGNEVEIFSRRMERMTGMLPDIVAAVRSEIKCKEVILEGEALAYNEETGEFYPFQQTIQRKRKHGVEEKSAEMPLHLFVFDIIYLDGEEVASKPLIERRKLLESIIKKGSSIITLSESYTARSASDIEMHFNEFVSRGLEGLMAKDLKAPYTAGARKFAWVKLKRSYRSELSDTIDLAIIGYFAGRGSRAKFRFGGILGGVYDPHTDMFYSLAKVGSGFSEEQMSELERLLSKIKVKHRPARVNSEMAPTYWVEPKYVITVKADEITRSPVHTAGKEGEGAGYALRFPRMVGGIRTDKKAEDATTVDEIIEMYKMQKKTEIGSTDEK